MRSIPQSQISNLLSEFTQVYKSMSLFLTGRAMVLGFDEESQTIQSQASDLKQLKIGLSARDIDRRQT